MIRASCLALALIAPVQAMALSCVAPSIERSYAQFAAAEQAYIVVHGRLTLDVSQLPKGMNSAQKPPRKTLLPGKLKGTSLSKRGFKLPFDQAVTLEVFCFGVWCGAARNGEDVLAFVRKDDNGYALAISPCGGTAFSAPKLAMLKRAHECMTQDNCTAE